MEDCGGGIVIGLIINCKGIDIRRLVEVFFVKGCSECHFIFFDCLFYHTDNAPLIFMLKYLT